MWRSFSTFHNDEEDVLCASCGTEISPQYPGQHQLPGVGFGAGATMGQCLSCMLKSALQRQRRIPHDLFERTAGPQDVASGGMLPRHRGGMLPRHGGGMLPGYGGGIDRFAGFRTPLDHEDGNIVLPQDKEIRMVLIGRTGSGKSATANTITGQRLFHSKVGGQSVTKQCKRTSTQRYGYSLQVVDTPGLFDTALSNTDTIKEVVKCVALTSPGPHAIILVTSIGRFTEEEKNTMEYFRAVFGEGINKYLFVIFTRKDDLDAEGTSIDDFVQTVPTELEQLLDDCSHRYIAFNNRLPHGDDQARTLLDMIEGNVKRNNGKCYTSEMYKEAEIVMKRREKQLAEEMEEHANQERQKLEWEFEKTLYKIKEDNIKQVSFFQDKLKVLETTSKESDEITALKKEIDNAKKQAEFDRKVKERKHMQEMKAMEKKLTEDQKMAREMAREEIEKEQLSLGIREGLKRLVRGIKNTVSRLFSRK